MHAGSLRSPFFGYSLCLVQPPTGLVLPMSCNNTEGKKEESGPIMGLGGIIFRFGFGHYGWLLSCRLSSCS